MPSELGPSPGVSDRGALDANACKQPAGCSGCWSGGPHLTHRREPRPPGRVREKEKEVFVLQIQKGTDIVGQDPSASELQFLKGHHFPKFIVGLSPDSWETFKLKWVI